MTGKLEKKGFVRWIGQRTLFARTPTIDEPDGYEEVVRLPQ